MYSHKNIFNSKNNKIVGVLCYSYAQQLYAVTVCILYSERFYNLVSINKNIYKNKKNNDIFT